jgi:5-methylcytosine-specific restriction endonuclease McrA
MANHFSTVEIICAQCGQATTRYWSGGNRARYCGNACKVAAYKQAHPHRMARSRAVDARRQRIADAYRISFSVLRGRPKPEPKQPIIRPCPDCGTALGYREIRCSPCREAHRVKARKGCPSRRADKARRKALQRGRIDGAERFDPLEILARDGWRCHICGAPTPKRLRGTYHDRAPELDHIVPLALGGQHTRKNTACACRRCNIAKAARPLGQLRLVA